MLPKNSFLSSTDSCNLGKIFALELVYVASTLREFKSALISLLRVSSFESNNYTAFGEKYTTELNIEYFRSHASHAIHVKIMVDMKINFSQI